MSAFGRKISLTRAGIALGAVGVLVGAVILFLGGPDRGAAGGSTDLVAGSPAAFLERVETALDGLGEVAHVTGRTTGIDGQATLALWSSEAWYDIDAGAVRSSLKKAPGNTLDLPDETVHLRTSEDVYTSLPGTDESTELLDRRERPACFDDEPESLASGLLCGYAQLGGPGTSITVEGAADFLGEPAHVLAVHLDNGRVLRLFVDPDTYVPLGQRMTQQHGGGEYVLETPYEVDAVARASLPPDFFDPRGLGYVPPDEVWLRILDASDLGMPVYWPGRAITGAGQFDAVLTRVEDRRGPPGKDTPGHVLSLGYEGRAGRFRLDYWPGQTWQAFLQLMGEGFLWASCSESTTSTVPAGELTLLLGHEPQAGIEALQPPQVATPGDGPPAPAPAYNPFPDGCPEGDHDRFLAVIGTEGGVVTINVPYGYCCQDGETLGAFDTEEGLLAIAEQLRLRRPGE